MEDQQAQTAGPTDTVPPAVATLAAWTSGGQVYGPVVVVQGEEDEDESIDEFCDRVARKFKAQLHLHRRT